jgi:hypothetical protein
MSTNATTLAHDHPVALTCTSPTYVKSRHSIHTAKAVVSHKGVGCSYQSLCAQLGLA